METNKNLTVRTTVTEVEAELTRRHVLLQPSVGGPSYAVDDHFSKYAYGDIASAEDALRLCDELAQGTMFSLSKMIAHITFTLQ